MHPCLFSHATRFNSLQLVTNPYKCLLHNRSLLAHAGQPIQDILMQVMDKDDQPTSAAGNSLEPMKVLQDTLRWGHMAPTAPGKPYIINLFIPF